MTRGHMSLFGFSLRSTRGHMSPFSTPTNLHASPKPYPNPPPPRFPNALPSPSSTSPKNLNHLKPKTATNTPARRSSVLILVKLINHNPIVPCQFPNTLNNSVTQKLNITAGERLQPRNCAHGELLRLNGTGDRKRWVLRARGLQIDDDSDVNPVKDAKNSHKHLQRLQAVQLLLSLALVQLLEVFLQVHVGLALAPTHPARLGL